MSRDVARRYRVRVGQRGIAELSESTVAFTLEVSDLAEVPVVAGSFVHPLDGATELRPLHVLGLDRSGSLIEAFTAAGRWAALGRLVDLQWQDSAADPSADPWTTYGTGRCSGLDEQEGPGLFRVEISDESWTARRGRVFTEAGTTSLWPPDRMWGRWKGYPRIVTDDAGGRVVEIDGSLSRIQLSIDTVGGSISIRDELVDYLKSLVLPPDDLDFTTAGGENGNFRYLVLRFPSINDVMVDWPVVSFGSLSADAMFDTLRGAMFDTLEDPELIEDDPDYRLNIQVWVRDRGFPFVGPKVDLFEDPFYLYAPGAPPHPANPLHVGMLDAPGDWAGASGSRGFLHVADATRRMWDALGVRYDASNLAALEADTSFPAVAPRITETPDDPERWAQDHWWGPLMLLALKDAQGRRKLKDLRPPPDDSDINELPVLEVSNSRNHRWRLVGRELVNSIIWKYETLGVRFGPGIPVARRGQYETPDGFQAATKELPAINGDTIDIALRERRFDATAFLADPASPATVIDHAAASTVGQPFLGDVVAQHTNFLLGVYQDGPVYGTCEISGSLVETLEEGDGVLVDCGSVKIANAGTAARRGHVRVLLLSLTRYPAHADAEYLVVRPAFPWTCGDPVYSPLNEHGTIRFRLGALVETESFTITVDARKDAAGGHQLDMEVALYQGATLIADWTETDVGTGETTYSFASAPGELSAITDWSALALEITRAGDVGGAEATHRRLIVTSFGAG